MYLAALKFSGLQELLLRPRNITDDTRLKGVVELQQEKPPYRETLAS